MATTSTTSTSSVLPVLPRDTLDDAEALLSLLGTFWSSSFTDGRPDLEALLRARGPAYFARQAEEDLKDKTTASLSRLDVPVLDTKTFLNVFLDKSTASLHASTYPHGLAGTGSCLSYPIEPSELTDDAPLRSASFLMDDPANPSFIYTSGSEFLVETPTEEEASGGEQTAVLTCVYDVSSPSTDDQRRLYVCAIDRSFVWLHAGYVAGLRKSKSTSEYLALTNAALDASYGGPSLDALYRALEAMSGVGFIKTDGEVVEYTTRDSVSQVVVTDRGVYRGHALAALSVAAGQTLRRNQAVFDTVRVLLPPFDNIPSDLGGVTLPASMSDPSLDGELTFENADKTLTVTEGVSGFTKVVWDMPLDDPGVVTAFFNLMHTRGVAASETLANRLDTRPQPQSTEPSAASLPLTINPLVDVLFRGVLRNHFIVVLLEPGHFLPWGLGQPEEGSTERQALRFLLPPETGLLVVS